MYADSFQKQQLPQTLTMADITLILKRGKPPDYCSSYRPVSLINVDNKILFKVFAKRIEDIIPKLVKPDQTGFIKQRMSTYNMRRLINIIHQSKAA